MKNKEITIYDIARQLNVSPGTVSRALKGHASIGEKTTRSVQELADKLGYQRNAIASSLRNSKTNTIGVIIPHIHRPFLSAAINGIEQVANEAGYNVIISQTNDSYQKEVANSQTLYASRVDGLLVSLAMETKDYEHFRPFQNKGIPLVFFDRVCPEIESGKVVIDNFSAAYKATEHLILNGYRRIAHVAGLQVRDIYQDRLKGYLAALRRYGLPVEDAYILPTRLRSEEGFRCTETLLGLRIPPDAIFTANDTTAVSAIQYARSMGIRIPDDLGIVGFNNDPIAGIIEPGLTTVAQPGFEMGQMASRQVLEQKISSHSSVLPKTVYLKTELIVRASSVPNRPRAS
jgi:DNA-binding LacI/PurR family transcriptional regulator